MHEIKLAENLVSILEREVKDPDVGMVKTIHLDVGKLRYIVPEIMTACFKRVPKSEKLGEAQLKINVIPIKTRRSASGGTEIVSGKEFKLKGIEW